MKPISAPPGLFCREVVCLLLCVFLYVLLCVFACLFLWHFLCLFLCLQQRTLYGVLTKLWSSQLYAGQNLASRGTDVANTLNFVNIRVAHRAFHVSGIRYRIYRNNRKTFMQLFFWRSFHYLLDYWSKLLLHRAGCNWWVAFKIWSLFNERGLYVEKEVRNSYIKAWSINFYVVQQPNWSIQICAALHNCWLDYSTVLSREFVVCIVCLSRNGGTYSLL